MPKNDRHEAGGPQAPSGSPPLTERTEVQTDDALAASVELSIPKHVSQHPEAPKLSGYVLCDRLGEGAYGQVWRSWQLRTRKEVAVKVFTQRSGLDWIFLQREVERLTRLDRHPHIVTLLDTGLDEEPPYYVMDLIEGGSLQKFSRPGATASPHRVLTWLEQACDALSYVHAKGLIHCDLKPANILVDSHDRVRVVDFGQSRVFTESAASMGTLFYMAPEQAKLAEPGSPVQPDVRWDVYAIGASAYAILTGHVPHASDDNVRTLESAPTLAERLERYRAMITRETTLDWSVTNGAAISPELQAVVNKCMARNANDRYPTIAALEADLRALRTNRPVTPLARSSGYRAKKFAQRNPILIGLIVAAIALAGAIVWASVRGARLDRARAGEIMAAFVHDPARAVSTSQQSGGRVAGYLNNLTGSFVRSPAYTERIMGARAAMFVDPTAFWQSVDGGPLWQNGEWLELLRADWPDYSVILEEIQRKAAGGSNREKYVAFCLLGQLAEKVTDRSAAINLCRSAVASEKDPGVVMAAWWAAKKFGEELTVPPSEFVFVDDLTGMTFAAIPPTNSFRRGSDESDPDRYEDEDRPASPVAIKRSFVATTELTVGLVRKLARDPAMSDEADSALETVLSYYAEVSDSQAFEISSGLVTLNMARALCDVLNAQAAGASPVRRYRLPAEVEWEYACRAGNENNRFGFGHHTDYARYFARCNGDRADFHTVAEFMPNPFGLFDLHGGLWELTDSIYDSQVPVGAVGQLWAKKGGAWYSPAVRTRCAQRQFAPADHSDFYTGVRIVLEFTP
jgi:formylglycine-generating enzyme required for sulfatase activity